MKRILLGAFFIVLPGCSSYLTEKANVTAPNCLGHIDLPQALVAQFEPIANEALLSQALGKPQQGKLCQGRVYQSKKNAHVTIYRAWNSTNPSSKFGQWWSFFMPSGPISQYREDYEICYQWSPLDKMVKCTLKPNTMVVVGNGQSAQCSKYLSYAASAKVQVYIASASSAIEHCTEYDGVMSWK
ncbi:hypothetical protein [Celerinatantimonas yamalensis]|uniref:Lipoprotein n=1 Tax=Celerinatantimonas yamalensis TaxID=559956 RepID=A0ABW9G3R3_9GAMM